MELLEFFCRHLTDGGLCVFTTHGRPVAEMFDRKETTFDLTEEGRQKVLSEYQQQGYGYADYPWTSSDGPSAGCIGISLSSQSRVVELARGVGSWEDVYYRESGWHTLQDVHASRRARVRAARSRNRDVIWRRMPTDGASRRFG